VTHDLTRTILTTVQHGAPVAGAMIGMVSAFAPGIAGQVLTGSIGLLSMLTIGAQAGLARIGNREAAAKSIERGPPEVTSISPTEQPMAEIEHGPPTDIGPPPAEMSGPPAEMSGPPAEMTGLPAEPTPPGAEQSGPELGL
jgi:hypothetical protein